MYTQDQFAEIVKNKLPQYKDVDNATVVNAYLEKNPQYKSVVESSKPFSFAEASKSAVAQNAEGMTIEQKQALPREQVQEIGRMKDAAAPRLSGETQLSAPPGAGEMTEKQKALDLISSPGLLERTYGAAKQGLGMIKEGGGEIISGMQEPGNVGLERSLTGIARAGEGALQTAFSPAAGVISGLPGAETVGKGIDSAFDFIIKSGGYDPKSKEGQDKKMALQFMLDIAGLKGAGATERGAAALSKIEEGVKTLPRAVPELAKQGATELLPKFTEMKQAVQAKATTAAEKLATEILQPSKNEVKLAKLAGDTASDAIKEYVKIAEVSETFDEALGKATQEVDTLMKQRNEILSKNNFDVDISRPTKELESYIAAAKKKGLAKPSEIQAMEEVLQSERKWLDENSPDRVTAQTRKEDVYNEAKPLYKKQDLGTASENDAGRVKAFEMLGKGYKDAVEAGDMTVRDINSRYGGLLGVKEMLAGRSALAQKAISPTLLQSVAEPVVNLLSASTGAGSAQFVAKLAAKQQSKLSSLTKRLVNLRNTMEKGGVSGAIKNELQKIVDEMSKTAEDLPPPKGKSPFKSPTVGQTVWKNPIDPKLSQGEKVTQLMNLSKESQKLVDPILKKMDSELGTISTSDLKKRDSILGKANRPSIKVKKPDFDAEHIGDGFRFETVLDHIDQIKSSIDFIKKEIPGAEIRADVMKMIQPKEWGWRASVFDIKLPNGQIVEYYLPVKEVESIKNGAGHALFKKWRNKDVSKFSSTENAAYMADRQKSYDLYDKAWKSYLKRTGQIESAVEASLKSLSASN